MSVHDQQQSGFAELLTQYQQNLQVHANVSAPIIITNEDKVRLVLNDLHKSIDEAKSWVAPIGILISLAATLVTADFKEIYGVKPDVFKGFYYCVTLIIFIWLVRAWRAKRKEMTDNDFVRKLKNESVGVSGSSQTVETGLVVSPRWVDYLERNQWSLEFRTGASKDMQFVKGGGILGGRNNNEHTWRAKDGFLELMEVDGLTVHSRFVFDDAKSLFTQTNDRDTPKASGQILRIKILARF